MDQKVKRKRKERRRKTLKNNLLQGGVSEEKINQIDSETLILRSEKLAINDLLDIYLKIIDCF